MGKAILSFLQEEATHLEQAGLLRKELPLQSPQGGVVTIQKHKVTNLASGDYLGLANHEQVKLAAAAALEKYGVGLAAPRMITGTLGLHTELEAAVSKLLGTQDTVLFPSGYHANTGVFESLLGERDYVFCDEQIHPGLADGVRLCRARVLSYRTNDLEHLEDRLQRSRSARFR